jgi:hypothetical protein
MFDSFMYNIGLYIEKWLVISMFECSRYFIVWNKLCVIVCNCSSFYASSKASVILLSQLTAVSFSFRAFTEV